MAETSALQLHAAPGRLINLIWPLLLLLFLFRQALAASEVYVGDVRGLEVQIEYLGYDSVSGGGPVAFERGSPLAYHVQVKNRANRSFSGVEIQSSLHSDGASCSGLNLFPGSLLPGRALSPFHAMSLAPSENYEYEAIYYTPPELCPSAGHLKIRIQFNDQGGINSTTLVAPLHFDIK